MDNINKLFNEHFKIEFNSKGLKSIVNPNDINAMDFILQDDNNYINYKKVFRELGQFDLLYSKNGKINKLFSTPVCSSDNTNVCFKNVNDDIEFEENFSLVEDYMRWDINIKNKTNHELNLLDFQLPLCFNTAYARAWQETYLRRAIRHSFVAGNGSFIFLNKAGGDPPFLLIMPTPGTSVDCFDVETTHDAGRFEGIYSIYLHANNKNQDKKWRLPTPNKVINGGESQSYGFVFKWVKNHDQIRECLYLNDLIDIRIMPGMTVPVELECKIHLRTKLKEISIISEFENETNIIEIDSEADNYLFSVSFQKLGENLITIVNKNGFKSYLQFFVTEPLEIMIKKRSEFITKNQFYKDKSKWFDGLIGLWNMKKKSSPNPDNTHGLQDYMVSGGDDCFKAPLLARKNSIYPNDEEIKIIEYYLENYVWGKHQRTDEEKPYPYGIHGGENWYVNRNNKIGFGSGGLGQDRMWRSFDYPHLVLVYLKMYEIAKNYPNKCNYLTFDQYLERAYRTAVAYFEVPIAIEMKKPWDFNGYPTWAYTQGNFNEKIIPDLINVLQNEGKEEESTNIKNEWEKKVKYFIYDHEFPFGSEMFFDATAFESTHAIAKYAINNDINPDEKLWQDPNSKEWYSHPEIKIKDINHFMHRQIQGNIACRGWLEMNFNQFGSDIRAGGNSSYNLSYMSQLGGWAVLDYGLNYSKDMYDHINLGYASILSSWALLNSGNEKNDFGYWFKGIENDGAAGWAYEPKLKNNPWGVSEMERGIWNVDGEIDMGLGSSIDSLCTILIDDPCFKTICYGGNLKEYDDRYEIFSLDGVRNKFHCRLKNLNLSIKLKRDQFSDTEPIIVYKNDKTLQMTINNTSKDDHIASIDVSSDNLKSLSIKMNGKDIIPDNGSNVFRIQFHNNSGHETIFISG